MARNQKIAGYNYQSCLFYLVTHDGTIKSSMIFEIVCTLPSPSLNILGVWGRKPHHYPTDSLRKVIQYLRSHDLGSASEYRSNPKARLHGSSVGLWVTLAHQLGVAELNSNGFNIMVARASYNRPTLFGSVGYFSNSYSVDGFKCCTDHPSHMS